MSSLFHTYLYEPIYNLLILLTGAMPGGDVGLAVIAVTLIVKIVTTPLSLSAVKTNRRMKHIEPELKAVREKYKDDKEKLAKETLSLYKNNGIRPFSSILASLIQIPVILALYLVFLHEPLLNVDLAILYSFIAIPPHISPLFLGIIHITSHSIILSAVAAVAAFVQARLAFKISPAAANETGTAADFSRAMTMQARYILPVVIAVVSYTSAAIALYLITSSIVAILQELYVRSLKHPSVPKGA